MHKQPDTIFNRRMTSVGDFIFDEAVANVFDDMIERSVPGYRAIVTTIGMLVAQYAQEGTNCYDLGSSLGAVTVLMQEHLCGRKCCVIAVDNSESMLERSRQRIDTGVDAVPVNLICKDLQDVAIENASVVVLNFTLQFIMPDQRMDIMQRIYDGMNAGGILIVSEKITFEHASEDNFQIDLYHAFKRLNGYSDMEISQKRTALENVLIPDTLKTHAARFQAAGFSQSHVWFQCFNFASMIAIK